MDGETSEGQIIGAGIAGVELGVQLGEGKTGNDTSRNDTSKNDTSRNDRSRNDTSGDGKATGMNGEDLRLMFREVMEDFFKAQRAQPDRSTETVKEAALMEDRTKRESLEQRVNELIAANEKARTRAEEAERSAAIRAELQRAGVGKLDLAYKAVQDEIYRSEDGRLVGQGGSELREYIARFVGENPELLPARLAGGSGANAGQRGAFGNTGSMAVDLDKIRPGMNPEELERVRQEIARVASQTLRGW